jgi:hypothetical protein
VALTTRAEHFSKTTRRRARDARSHAWLWPQDLLCTALSCIVGKPKLIVAGCGNPGLRDATSGHEQTQRADWHGCQADRRGGHQAPEQQEM